MTLEQSVTEGLAQSLRSDRLRGGGSKVFGVAVVFNPGLVTIHVDDWQFLVCLQPCDCCPCTIRDCYELVIK